jgi:hypothetical protein
VSADESTKQPMEDVQVRESGVLPKSRHGDPTMPTARSSDRFARTVSVVALIISIVAPGLGIYFLYFHWPEDLQVSARVQQHAQVGTGHLNLVLLFANRGRRAVAIEKVSLGLDYGKGARIEDVSDWQFEGQVAMRETVGGIPGNTTKMQNGALLAVYDATRQTIDNRDVSSSAVLVAGNSVVLINLSFEPARIDFSTEGPIVQFVAIRYFDNDGGERLRRRLNRVARVVDAMLS